MTATAPNWRPQVKAGDVLRISATYDTTRASWYEVMGIMVVWEAWDQRGTDPFTHRLDEQGHITHGYLRQNNDNGGSYSLGIKPMTFPRCFRHTVTIAQFRFDPGDFTATGGNRCMPTIHKGQQLKFVNDDASPLNPGIPAFNPTAAYMASVFHTVTACKDPCGLNTGISYPLANGAGHFDSGELGLGTPALGNLSWSTPALAETRNVHVLLPHPPWMRGVFRVIG